jgi:leucyl-tRNA---protein transferase
MSMWDAEEPRWRDDPPLSCRLPDHPCNFLPDRQWSLLAIHDQSVDRLMQLGGGRFGPIYCLPACRQCRACHPARIDLEKFRWSRSMRRTRNRNDDLEQRIDRIHLTDQKYQLFEKFVTTQFGTKTEHIKTLKERLAFYESWHLNQMDCTREVSYWLEDRLLAVSTIDVGENGIYSHYCYYDLTVPRRRLGVYTFLKEIEMCQDRQWPYLYIGFMNMESKKLRYKEQFGGLEVLVANTGWTPLDDSPLASETAQSSGDQAPGTPT